MAKKLNATEEALGALHGLLAEYMTNVLKVTQEDLDASGTEVDGVKIEHKIPSSFLNVVRAFLKENNIEALMPEAGESSTGMSDESTGIVGLSQALKDFEEATH